MNAPAVSPPGIETGDSCKLGNAFQCAEINLLRKCERGGTRSALKTNIAASLLSHFSSGISCGND